MEQNGIQVVLHCLPPQIRSRIQQLSAAELAQVQEQMKKYLDELGL